MFKQNKLIELMEKHKTTGIELAKITGVKPPTISSWRKGKKVPKIENIEKIANYYKVPIEYLTGEEEKLKINQENVINNNTNIGYKIENNNNGLNESELELIEIYRKLEKRRKLKLIDRAYELEEEEKNVM